MLNPSVCILCEFLGEMSVGRVFVFDVELIVEFLEVSGDFAGFKGFVLLR